MNVLLVTYNYYPFHWGGSEVYVKGLAEFIQSNGHNVTIVAGVSSTVYQRYKPVYRGKKIDAFQYDWEGVSIFGLHLKRIRKKEIYTKRNIEWLDDFIRIIDFHFPQDIQMMHFHAFTPMLSFQFINQLKIRYPDSACLFSVHTPVSCLKGTLINKKREQCFVRISVEECYPCWLYDSAGRLLPLFLVFNAITPKLYLTDILPAWSQGKYLADQSIKAFNNFITSFDGYMVFSHQIKQVLEKQKVEPKKIRVIRHGIDPIFRKKDMPKHNHGHNKFAFIGRFEKIKGIITLISAWNILPQSLSRELHLVGKKDHDQDQQIRKEVEYLQLRNDVHVHPEMTRKEIVDFLNQMDCVIIPSEWIEIGPLVFHEAIACGCNVITSDIGGNLELAEYYKTGIQLFETGNAVSLADKILKFKHQKTDYNPIRFDEHYLEVLKWYKDIFEIRENEI